MRKAVVVLGVEFGGEKKGGREKKRRRVLVDSFVFVYRCWGFG